MAKIMSDEELDSLIENCARGNYLNPRYIYDTDDEARKETGCSIMQLERMIRERVKNPTPGWVFI